jgi:hypothetical protein
MFPTRYQYFYRSPEEGKTAGAVQERRERDTTRGLLLIAAVVAIPVALMALASVLFSAG